MGAVRQGYADQPAVVGVVDADFGLLRQRAEGQIRGEQDRHRSRAPGVGGLAAFFEAQLPAQHQADEQLGDFPCVAAGGHMGFVDGDQGVLGGQRPAGQKPATGTSSANQRSTSLMDGRQRQPLNSLKGRRAGASQRRGRWRAYTTSRCGRRTSCGTRCEGDTPAGRAVAGDEATAVTQEHWRCR